jgi:predicted flavoprotein YhiN
MSRTQRQKITSAVKELRLEIDGFAGFEKAVVTSGGISLKR